MVERSAIGTWLVEHGIGEERAIQLDRGGIAAARLRWPGTLAHGAVIEAVVAERFPLSSMAIVRFSSGEDAIGRRLPKSDSEGTTVRMLVEREAIAERGRLKRALAVKTDLPLDPSPSLADSLRKEGYEAQVVHRFPDEADWEELFAEAWSGEVAFHGGALLFSITPAMTLIDVDGHPVEAITFNAVPALARALRRFDIAGNIGVDFPTLTDRLDRKAVDSRLEDELAGWPHERTAMNGFGFVQIVSRLMRASILQQISLNRRGAAARLLLRRAERVAEAGALLLTAHPAIIACLKPEWLAELSRRSGREVRIANDPKLALEAGFAQAVPL